LSDVILSDEERTPTEQFRDAREKIEEEAKILRERLEGHSRSHTWVQLFLNRHGLVEEADLGAVSAVLREHILRLSRDLDA